MSVERTDAFRAAHRAGRLPGMNLLFFVPGHSHRTRVKPSPGYSHCKTVFIFIFTVILTVKSSPSFLSPHSLPSRSTLHPPPTTLHSPSSPLHPPPITLTFTLAGRSDLLRRPWSWCTVPEPSVASYRYSGEGTSTRCGCGCGCGIVV